MKHYFLVVILTITIQLSSQNLYHDSTSPNNMAAGVYYQSGPGGNNGSYDWEFPYGTKLTVNTGALLRNFEIMTATYPFGNLKLRQWDYTTNNWTLWRNILVSDGNGNVGIGKNSSGSKLLIYRGNSGGAPHGYSDLTIEDSLDGMISILTPNNKYGYFGFSDNDDDYVGGMQYNHSKNEMTFRVNNHSNDMMINSIGNVGIGTTTPDEKLAVNGNIHTKEVRVDLNGWSDFVFKSDYKLPTLQEVEQHIKEKGHLQDIPSAREVAKNGILLGDMNAKLLQKIEELTLYTIQQQRLIEKQSKVIENQSKLIKEIQLKL